MRFGIVILPQDPWSVAKGKWQQAEQLGFDHAWTYDHLSWRSLADQPWGATIPTLTAAATVTSTIRLGTFVGTPNYRHPVPFAKEVAAVDEIAGGRFILGLGSGGTGFDATMLGQPLLSARQRHERYAEFVELLDELLRFEKAGPISSSGEWFSADGARMVGAPAQQPRMPFVLAANGPKGLAVVSRFGDGWVTTGPDGVTGEEWWKGVADAATRLDAALAASGRTVDRYLSFDSGGQYSLDSVAAFEDQVLRASELGFTDVIAHWPRREGIYAGSEDVLHEVADRLATLRT